MSDAVLGALLSRLEDRTAKVAIVGQDTPGCP